MHRKKIYFFHTRARWYEMRHEQNLAFGAILQKALEQDDEDLEIQLHVSCEPDDEDVLDSILVAVIDNAYGMEVRAPIRLFKKSVIAQLLLMKPYIAEVEPYNRKSVRRPQPTEEQKARLRSDLQMEIGSRGVHILEAAYPSARTPVRYGAVA